MVGLCITRRKVLGGMAFVAQVIPPIPTHFSVVWSVSCLSLSCVTFVHFAWTVTRM